MTDVVEQGGVADRNALAGGIISSVVELVEQFAENGFGPLREAYNACHGLHGLDCRIVEGTGETPGTVEGVSATGQLLLRTEAGVVAFDGGEVSLRKR